MKYEEFINQKSFKAVAAGLDADLSGYPLFDYQRDIVRWACARGKAAIFADTGLGKTLMQLTWADQVAKHTGGRVIVLAPLAVKEQTIAEGDKFGINMAQIDVENYEQLHNIDAGHYVGVVLDESSILKGMEGKIRRQVTEMFRATPYRLSCTATPSPNDFMELGTQAEFLGIMSQVEMLAMFFIHDGADTSKWRLKGHGKRKFFEWLATWAVFITKPSDLGYSDDGHELSRRFAEALVRQFYAPPVTFPRIERLTKCLKKANEGFEHYEREWYLRGEEIERLQGLSAAGAEAAAEGKKCRNPYCVDGYVPDIPDGNPVPCLVCHTAAEVKS